MSKALFSEGGGGEAPHSGGGFGRLGDNTLLAKYLPKKSSEWLRLTDLSYKKPGDRFPK